MKTHFGLTVFLLCLVVPMNSFAGDESPNLKAQSSNYLVLIDLYSGQKNLGRLLSTVGEIDRMWSVENSETYFDLMATICVRLHSVDFADNRQCELLQKCVASILNKNIQAPIDMQLSSVALLMAPTEPSCKEDSNGANNRKTNSEFVLQVWRNLKKTIEQERLPEINVAPPPGANIRPGGSPEEIKDPKVRLAYEEELARNRKQTEWYNKLSKLESEYSKRAESYIIQVYSRPPFNLEELKGLLKEYVSDEASKLRILEAVTKSTGTK